MKQTMYSCWKPAFNSLLFLTLVSCLAGCAATRTGNFSKGCLLDTEATREFETNGMVLEPTVLPQKKILEVQISEHVTKTVRFVDRYEKLESVSKRDVTLVGVVGYTLKGVVLLGLPFVFDAQLRSEGVAAPNLDRSFPEVWGHVRCESDYFYEKRIEKSYYSQPCSSVQSIKFESNYSDPQTQNTDENGAATFDLAPVIGKMHPGETFSFDVSLADQSPDCKEGMQLDVGDLGVKKDAE